MCKFYKFSKEEIEKGKIIQEKLGQNGIYGSLIDVLKSWIDLSAHFGCHFCSIEDSVFFDFYLKEIKEKCYDYE